MATRAQTKPKTPSKTKAKTRVSAGAPKTKPAKPKSEPTSSRANPAPPELTGSASATTAKLVTELKRKELIDEVSQRTELPKNKVRPVVDAMLEAMGEAAAQGRQMNLQPFGRLVHKRSKDTPNATVHVMRLRQNKSQD